MTLDEKEVFYEIGRAYYDFSCIQETKKKIEQKQHDLTLIRNIEKIKSLEQKYKELEKLEKEIIISLNTLLKLADKQPLK